MLTRLKNAYRAFMAPQEIAPVLKKSVRNYHGAAMSHLTSLWSTTSRSADADIRNDLVALRSRSRVLAKDNDYMRSFLRSVVTNVVGHNGFSLRMRIKDANGEFDQLANKAIADAFKAWSKRKNCDIAKKLSFVGLCQLMVRTLARDGEVLVRKVRGRKINKFGFALQLLAIDRLEVTLNQTMSNGNLVRMGVEIDSFGCPIAYHLRTDHPGDNVYRSQNGSRYERVPASDLLHVFIQEDPEQTRGVPWVVSAMTRLNHLGAFDEAAVIAARIGASKMGWFKKSDAGMPGVPGAEESDIGDFTQEASPGEFGILPDGYDFVGFDPDYPHANYAPFTKACLRGISSGIGVNYNSFASDLEGVNYTSLRAGVLTERDYWMLLQNFFIDAVLEDIQEDWLKVSLLLEAITLPNGTALPATKYEKFNQAQFMGRRWPWVDPLKDLQASALAIDEKLASRSEIHAEQGSDFIACAEELAAEEKVLKSYGLQEAQNRPRKPKEKESEDQN